MIQRLTRLFAVSLLDAALLFAAVLVLGIPDLHRATAFARGDYPTMASATAAAQLLLWVALVGVVAVTLWDSARLVTAAWQLQRRVVREGWVVLTLGMLILGVGMARHFSPAASLCCGSVQEARSLLQR